MVKKYLHLKDIPPHTFSKEQPHLCDVLEQITPLVPIRVTYLANLIPNTSNTQSIFVCKLTETPNHQEEVYCIFQLQINYAVQKTCDILYSTVPKIVGLFGGILTTVAFTKQFPKSKLNDFVKIGLGIPSASNDKGDGWTYSNLYEFTSNLLPFASEETIQEMASHLAFISSYYILPGAHDSLSNEYIREANKLKKKTHGKNLRSMKNKNTKFQQIPIVPSKLHAKIKENSADYIMLKNTFSIALKLGQYAGFFLFMVMVIHAVKYILKSPLKFKSQELKSIHLCTPTVFPLSTILKEGCRFVDPVTKAVGDVVYIRALEDKKEKISKSFHIKYKPLLNKTSEYYKPGVPSVIKDVEKETLLKHLFAAPKNESNDVLIPKTKPFNDSHNILRSAIDKAMPYALDMSTGDITTIDRKIIEKMETSLEFTNWWSYVFKEDQLLTIGQLPDWIPKPYLQINHYVNYMSNEKINIPISSPGINQCTIEDNPLSKSILSVEGTEELCTYSIEKLFIKEMFSCLFMYHIRTNKNNYLVAIQHILLKKKIKDSNNLTITSHELQNTDLNIQKWYVMEITINDNDTIQTCFKAILDSIQSTKYVSYNVINTNLSHTFQSRQKIKTYTLNTIPSNIFKNTYNGIVKCEILSSYSDAHLWTRLYYSRLQKKQGGRLSTEKIYSYFNLSSFVHWVVNKILILLSEIFKKFITTSTEGLVQTVGVSLTSPNMIGAACILYLFSKLKIMDENGNQITVTNKYIFKPFQDLVFGLLTPILLFIKQKIYSSLKQITTVINKITSVIQKVTIKTKKIAKSAWDNPLVQKLIQIVAGFLAGFIAFQIWTLPSTLETIGDQIQSKYATIATKPTDSKSYKFGSLSETESQLLLFVFRIIPYKLIIHAGFLPLSIGILNKLRKLYAWKPSDETSIQIFKLDTTQNYEKEGYLSDDDSQKQILATRREKQLKRRQLDAALITEKISQYHTSSEPIEIPSQNEIEQITQEVSELKSDATLTKIIDKVTTPTPYQSTINNQLLKAEKKSQHNRIKKNIKRVEIEIATHKNALRSTRLSSDEREILLNNMYQDKIQLKELKLIFKKV